MAVFKTDHRKKNKIVRRFRRKGFPKQIAKTAGYCAATPGRTLPELTSKLGDVWMQENGNRGFQVK
jgi:hypothetical protein